MTKALLPNWISSDRPRRDLSPASRSSSSTSPSRSPRDGPLGRPLPSYLPLPPLPSSPPLPPLPPTKAKGARVKPPLFVDTSLKYDTSPSLPIKSESRQRPLKSAPLVPTRDSTSSGGRSVGSWMTSSQPRSRSTSPTDTPLSLEFPAVPTRRRSESQSLSLRTSRSDSAGSAISGFRSKVTPHFKTLFNSRTSSNSSHDAVLSTLSSPQSVYRRTMDASSSSTPDEIPRSSSPAGTLLITKPERRDSTLPRRGPRRRSRPSISQPYSPPLTPKSSPFTHHRRKSSVPSSPRTVSSRTSKAAATPPGGLPIEGTLYNGAPSNRRGTLVPSKSAIDVCIMDTSGDRPGVRTSCEETSGVTITLRAHHRPEEMEFEWKCVTEVDAAGRESTTWEVSLRRKKSTLGLSRTPGPPSPSPSLPPVDPVSPFLPSISAFPSVSTSATTSTGLDDLLASPEFNASDLPAEESDSSMSFYSSSPRKQFPSRLFPHSDVTYQPFFFDGSDTLSSTETDRRGSIPSPPTCDGRVSPSSASLSSDRSAKVVSLGDLILSNRYSTESSHSDFTTEGGHPFRFPRRLEESSKLRSKRVKSSWSDTDAESEYGETSWARLGDGRDSVYSQYGPVL